MAVHVCKNCGGSFELNSPGRPPNNCPECRKENEATGTQKIIKKPPVPKVRERLNFREE